MEDKQFETLMQAIAELNTSLNARMDKSDAKNDDRFELIKAEFLNFNGKLGDLKDEMKSGFARVDAKLDSITKQVGETHVEVTDLKARVSALEGPSA